MTARSRSPQRDMWDLEEWGISDFATQPGIPSDRIVNTRFKIPGGVVPILTERMTPILSANSSRSSTPKSRRSASPRFENTENLNLDVQRNRTTPFGEFISETPPVQRILQSNLENAEDSDINWYFEIQIHLNQLQMLATRARHSPEMLP